MNEVSALHSENAVTSTFVTLAGIFTVTSPRQPANTRLGSKATSGMVIVVNPLQYRKAWGPMLTTLGEIATVISPLQPLKADCPTVAPEGIVTLVSALHPPNAEVPRLFTLAGRVKLDNAVHPANANREIVSTPLADNCTSVKAVH